VRVTPDEYEQLDLRAHSLLAGVAIHDIWMVDLSGAYPGRTIVDLRALLAAENLLAANPIVRFLFGLRMWLGRVFRADVEPARAFEESFIHKLSTDERERSLVVPGTREGIFRALFVTPRESISEVQNATVHAFSVFALVDRPAGYRLFWAIYVRPVSRITAWYMRLIDPFRRALVYPSALRRIRKAWERDLSAPAA